MRTILQDQSGVTVNSDDMSCFRKSAKWSKKFRVKIRRNLPILVFKIRFLNMFFKLSLQFFALRVIFFHVFSELRFDVKLQGASGSASSVVLL